jgi:hypothetical protein
MSDAGFVPKHHWLLEIVERMIPMFGMPKHHTTLLFEHKHQDAIQSEGRSNNVDIHNSLLRNMVLKSVAGGYTSVDIDGFAGVMTEERWQSAEDGHIQWQKKEGCRQHFNGGEWTELSKARIDYFLLTAGEYFCSLDDRMWMVARFEIKMFEEDNERAILRLLAVPVLQTVSRQHIVLSKGNFVPEYCMWLADTTVHTETGSAIWVSSREFKCGVRIFKDPLSGRHVLQQLQY